MAEYIEGWLKAQGLRVERQNLTSHRFNVLATLGEGRPHLLLTSHMDTVADVGLEVPQGEVRGGVLYGRGACDAKASLAAMMVAFSTLADAGVKGTLSFAAVCDEEYRGLGTRRLVRRLRPDYAVVGEPTGLTPAIAHKGFAWIEVATLGLPAHGSVPDQGVDAIEKMGRVISGLTGLAEKARRMVDPELGPVVLHMGTIRGGREPSVVPDRCRLVVEWRTLPSYDGGRALEEVRGLLEELERKDPQLRAAARLLLERPPLKTPSDNLLVEACVKATGRKPIALPYWTDGATLREALRIPVVVMGPGDIKVAHSRVEQVALEEVRRAAETYRQVAERLMGG